jgi:hypothetical protein
MQTPCGGTRGEPGSLDNSNRSGDGVATRRRPGRLMQPVKWTGQVSAGESNPRANGHPALFYRKGEDANGFNSEKTARRVQ